MVQVSTPSRKYWLPPRHPHHYCTCGYILPRGLYYRIQGPLLGKSIGGFSPPIACRVHFSTLKASQQRGHFQISSVLISLYAATKMCCVFLNRVLPVSYNKQSRATVVACVVLWDSGGSLTNNAYSGIPHLTLRFSHKNLCLLGQTSSSYIGHLHSN